MDDFQTLGILVEAAKSCRIKCVEHDYEDRGSVMLMKKSVRLSSGRTITFTGLSHTRCNG